MGTTYDIGDVVRLSAKWSTASGSTVYSDPSKVLFSLEDPNGTVTTGSLSPPTTQNDNINRLSTGEFYYDVNISTGGSGIYEYRWSSSGLLTSAQEGWFNVRPTRVTT